MLVLNHRTAPAPTYTPRTPPPSSPIPKKSAQKSLVDTPPTSPPTEQLTSPENVSPLFSIDNYPEIIPHVRAITAEQLDAALTAVAKIPLPDADTVFPWLHGIHPSNPDQRYFFSQPRGVELPPPSTYRGIALVAAHSREQNRHGRLVGSIEANDLFQQDEDSICFVQPDPLKGVSLRNFHIQARKIAMLSDIVIYDIGSGIDSDDTLLFASCVADAQRKYRNDFQGQVPEYHTFIVSESFAVFEETYPSRVAQDSTGKATRFDMDFLEMERTQMCVMSRATEIAQNVYMGSTADWDEDCTYYQNGKIPPAGRFSIHIRCEDYVLIPSVKDNELRLDDDPDHVLEVSFPSSGCLGTPSETEITDLVDFCGWLYQQTHEASDAARAHNSSKSEWHPSSSVGSLTETADASFSSDCNPTRKVLLTCKDGYTETTLLALAYTIYVNCMTVDEAWTHLHRAKKRNFYAFAEDVSSIQLMSRQLIEASPFPIATRFAALARDPAPWFSGTTTMTGFSGSFPSRILDHLYLGNLEHANKTDMLEQIGITRIVSVGERPLWMNPQNKFAPPAHYKFVQSIQDDGIDSLTGTLEECLHFIDEGFRAGQATLVHCRVGVSRSATICIAEVVRRLSMTLPEAYLLVRARRLNVIIQPNLRFMYELHKWTQEELSKQKGGIVPRSLEWPQLAQKIASLNSVYIST